MAVSRGYLTNVFAVVMVAPDAKPEIVSCIVVSGDVFVISALRTEGTGFGTGKVDADGNVDADTSVADIADIAAMEAADVKNAVLLVIIKS